MRLFTHPRMLSAILILYAQFVTGAARSGDVDHLPEYARACVLANGCSGTIVSKGPEWARGITAAHCFRGKIGATFTCWYLDGTHSDARLLTVDRTRDLACFAVPSSAVLGTAAVPNGIPDKARYEAVAWSTEGSGESAKRVPYYFLLCPARNHDPYPRIEGGVQFDPNFYRGIKDDKGHWHWYPKTEVYEFSKSYDPKFPWDYTPKRWLMAVDNGGIIPGTSGCGLFMNGQYAGALSNAWDNFPATGGYFSAPDQVAAFIRESDSKGKCDRWNMGEWSAPVCSFANAPPPLLATGSNKRLISYAPSLPAPQGAAPPPPDAGHTKAPPPEDVKGEAAPQTDTGVYSGHGKKPKDLKTIKLRTKAIDQTRHDLAQTQAQLEAELEAAKAQLEAEIEAVRNAKAELPPEKVEPAKIEPPAVVAEESSGLSTTEIVALVLGGLVALVFLGVTLVVTFFSVVGVILALGKVASFIKALFGK